MNTCVLQAFILMSDQITSDKDEEADHFFPVIYVRNSKVIYLLPSQTRKSCKLWFLLSSSNLFLFRCKNAAEVNDVKTSMDAYFAQFADRFTCKRQSSCFIIFDECYEDVSFLLWIWFYRLLQFIHVTFLIDYPIVSE